MVIPPRSRCIMWIVRWVLLVQFSCLVSSLPKPCPKFDILYGRTRSRSRGRAMRVTCNRGYNLIGERTLLCNKGRWDSDLPVCAKTGCKLPEARIPGGRVLTSYRDQILRTVCEDGFEIQGSPLIFCNGVVWNDTLPLCVGKPGVKACDFEGKDHFCGWHQTRGMLAWQMGYDPLENWVSNYAPDFDHTYGVGSFGHYIHMKGPTDDNPFVTSGQLKSPFYRKPENPQVCFQFWYHVFGEDAGDLKVMVNREVVWSKQQINRKIWQRGAFKLVANSTYQIIIEASIPNEMVTVAVDDLEVIENCTGMNDYAFQNKGSSCQGRCGDDGSLEDCSCDFDCKDMDNCCPDYSYFCPNMTTGSDTTVSSGTTVMVANGNPITTFQPVEEVESATSPSTEQSNQNISDGTNLGSTDDNQSIHEKQTTVSTNQEDNNIDKIEESFDIRTDAIPIGKENQTFTTKPSETIDERRNKDLYSGTNEIDVPVDDSNETVTSQVVDSIEGAGSSNQSDTIFEVNRKGVTDTKDTVRSAVEINSTDTKTSETSVGGDTQEELNEKTTYESENDQVIPNQSGISLNPNLSANRKRMRESVKKSTVVFDDDETQVNPTSNKTAFTLPIEYMGNKTDSSVRVNNVLSNEDDTTKQSIVRDTELQVASDQPYKNDTSERTIGKIVINASTAANISDEVLFKKYSEDSNKESSDIFDIIKTKDSKTDVERGLPNPETKTNSSLYLPQNERIAENETATVINSNTSIVTNSKSLNFETPINSSNLNRNFTKIILYKSSTNENSTNQNASGTLHTNDISRVQIHTNVQPNGVFVENVKISNQEKYNESTISRLKIINEHITNVISKRNKTLAPNATSDGNENNATALHKLKHFITTIIDSHNNLMNNTDSVDTRTIVNLTEDNLDTQDQVKNTAINSNSNYSNKDSDGVDLHYVRLSPNNVTSNTSQISPTLLISDSPNDTNKVNLSQPDEEKQPPEDTLFYKETPNKPSKEIYADSEVGLGMSKDPLMNSESLELARDNETTIYQSSIKPPGSLVNKRLAETDGAINSSLNNNSRDRNFYSGITTALSKETNYTPSNKTSETYPSRTSIYSNLSSTTPTSILLSRLSGRYKPRFIITRRYPTRFFTPSWRLKTDGTKDPLSNLTQPSGTTPPYKLFGIENPKRQGGVRVNMTSLFKRLNISTKRWPTRLSSSTSTLKPSNGTLNTIRSNTTWGQNKWFWRNRTPSSTPSTISDSTSSDVLFSINLLKSTSNSSLGAVKNVDESFKYDVWESTESSTRNQRREEFIVHSASSKNDNHDNSTSIVSVTSILLVLIAVLLSTLTSYCLVQRYRRARPDDTEIEYLTGDELLYFHTPSPHLKSSHRSSRLESEDGTF